jgi:lysozyme family protein
MANFDEAFQLTMKSEGGYANNPHDTGGETYKGISRKNNPSWSGWHTIDSVKAAHPASLNTALAQQAELQVQIKHFYQVNYWDVNQTGGIHDQQLANQVFDTAVNCGTGSAAKFLQQAAGVKVDLQVGPVTLAAVNSADAKTVYSKFIGFRKQYYEHIIANNPSQQQFRASWFSRLPDYKNMV